MQYKATKSEDSRERHKAKRDPILAKKQRHINAWIDENINDMEDVRKYLKRLTRAVRAGQISKKN